MLKWCFNLSLRYSVVSKAFEISQLPIAENMLILSAFLNLLAPLLLHQQGNGRAPITACSFVVLLKLRLVSGCRLAPLTE
jgi:hypothetical protein